MTGVASISAIASALPEKVLDNETLAHQFPEWTAQKSWIKPVSARVELLQTMKLPPILLHWLQKICLKTRD
jgi:hypothetical protein